MRLFILKQVKFKRLATIGSNVALNLGEISNQAEIDTKTALIQDSPYCSISNATFQIL